MRGSIRCCGTRRITPPGWWPGRWVWPAPPSGELLGTDGLAFLPVLLASGVGQYVRHHLLRIGTNLFVVTAAVSLFTASMGGLGAHLTGSGTVDLAMFASTLLLVPGVPATNAQADVMDGYPTLGSARAVTVLMVMAFVTTGIWLARILAGGVR